MLRAGGLAFERCPVVEGGASKSSSFTTCCLSACGGPVAVVSSEGQLLSIFSSLPSTKGTSSTSSKLLLGEYKLPDRQQQLLLLHFLPDLSLLLVFPDGCIMLWDGYLLPQPQSSSPSSSPRQVCHLQLPLLRAVVFHSSLAVLCAASSSSSSSLDLVLIHDLKFTPRRVKLANKIPLAQAPRCLAVLRPWASAVDATVLPEFAIGIPDQPGMIVVLPNGAAEARIPSPSSAAASSGHEPSRSLVPHPTEDLVCSIDLADHLLVTTVHFDVVFFSCRLDHHHQGVPRSVQWIMGGAGFAVGVVWPDSVQIAAFLGLTVSSSPRGGGAVSSQLAKLDWNADDAILGAHAEFDGLKIVSTRSTSILRRVPQCVSACFPVATGASSSSTAALLLRAVQSDFPSLSSRAGQEDGEFDDVEAACHDLLDCAKFARDDKQRALLFRACQFGRDRLLALSAANDDGTGAAAAAARRRRRLRKLTDKLVVLMRLAKAMQRLAAGHGAHSATWLEVLQLSPRVFASRLVATGFADECAAFCEEMYSSTSGIEAANLAGVQAMRRAQLDGTPASSSVLCQSALGVACHSAELADKEDRLDKRILALVHFQAYDRVLQVLATARGVDFDLRARTALHLLDRGLVPERKLMTSSMCEPAIRATLRASGNVAKLDKWILACRAAAGKSDGSVSLHPPHERALLLLTQAFAQQKQLGEGALDMALVEEALKDFDAVKTSGSTFFLHQQTKDLVKLLVLQREHHLPLGKSVGDTLVHCFARNKLDVVDKLRQRLRVRPQLVARCRLHGFAAKKQFVEACRAVLTNEFGMAASSSAGGGGGGGGVTVDEVVELAFEHRAHAALARMAFEELPKEHEQRARIFLRLKMYPEAVQSAEESQCEEVMEILAGSRAAGGAQQERAQLSLDALREQKQLERQQQGAAAGNALGRCQTQ